MLPSYSILQTRPVGQVPYNGGGFQTLEVDRDGILLGLNLRFRFTITNGATGPATPTFQTLARILRRAEVKVQGRDTVWSVSGDKLAARLTYENGQIPYGMESTVVLTGSAATAYEIIVPLDFDLPRDARRTDDCGIDTRGLTQLSLGVTWGAIADFFATVNGAALSGVTCDVEGRYLLNPPANKPYLVRALDEVQQPNVGNNSAFSILLDRGTGLVYRTLALFATRDNVGVANMLGANATIKCVSGAFTFFDRQARQVIAENRREYDLKPPAGVAGSPEITGLYMLPLLYDGQLSTGVDTSKLEADMRLVLDTTYTSGAEMFTVQREAIRPLKIA